MDIKLGYFTYQDAEIKNIRANHFPTINEFNIVIDDAITFQFNSYSELKRFVQNISKLVNDDGNNQMQDS